MSDRLNLAELKSKSPKELLAVAEELDRLAIDGRHA